MANKGRDVLPTSVKPIHYDISLYDLELGGSFTFKGIVNIEVKVQEATKEIVINSNELKIHKTTILSNNSSLESSNVSYDKKSQRATVTFPQEITSSAKSIIRFEFEGVMNNNMAGFYRSKYKPTSPPHASTPKDGEYHCMFSTQFESCDARRAFPCFDEPNLKATFDFKIEIPSELTALSNMPEKEVTPGKNGLKIVSFERSPVMSTYLLAWAFGDFEYIEGFTKRKYNNKQIPVRVYTTRGLKEQGRFAMDVASDVVDYFSDVFKIDYPLPKIDLLAVQEFAQGAMENWGLITYRTVAILYEEGQTAAKDKNFIAYVVSHELAHQWFGNLVTMDWWDALWLNESFATWAGWLAVDHLHPEWQVWSQFITEYMQRAMQLDSLRSSHPVEVPVNDVMDIDQIFDAICYLKGCSVLRMLVAHIGVDKFLDGVSEYLQAHVYGNASTDDLWAAIGKVSGIDVSSIMEEWIRKIGYPVLTVAEEPGQIGLHQARFLSTGDVKPDDDGTTWWIPLNLKSDAHVSGVAGNALTVKQETVRNMDEKFYKINANQSGFYRTNYPPERLVKFGSQLDKLSFEDKIGLVGDAAALAIAGNATTASLLALCTQFHSETNYHVWSEVMHSLSNIQSIFAENEVIARGMNSYILRLVSSAVEKIGWEFKPNDSSLDAQLRALLIVYSGYAGHQGTVSEAQNRFAAYISGDQKAIHPELKSAVFNIVVKHGGSSVYEAVKKEYLNTTSTNGKDTCLRALGRVQSRELIADLLDFHLSDEVALQNIHLVCYRLGYNAKARDQLWTYIKEHWSTIYAKLSSNPILMLRYVKCLTDFASHEVEQDISDFFKDKDTRGYDTGVVQVLDSIKGNTAYRERDERLLSEWLQSHGFA